jgi:hypothetical protein
LNIQKSAVSLENPGYLGHKSLFLRTVNQLILCYK